MPFFQDVLEVLVEVTLTHFFFQKRLLLGTAKLPTWP
jgi:hypothetical protein